MAESSITLTGGPYSYGDTVTFDYTVEKLKGYEHPMVALVAFQDIDEDGDVETDIHNADLLFVTLAEPDADYFALLAQKWEERGGDAVARLDLFSYGWKGGEQSIRLLASTEEFPVTGP